MKRLARTASLLLLAAAFGAGVVLACTSIPEPATRSQDAAPADGGLEAGDAASDGDGAFTGCRGGGWRSLRGYGVLITGNAGGTQVLAGSGVFTEGDAGPIVYEVIVTGRADQLAGKPPVDLASPANASLATCAYCTLALGQCVQTTNDAISCESQYQAVAGQARTVTAATQDGGAYWIDVGNVVLVRVLRREGFAAAEVDPTDCIALDRLTLQGQVVQIERPCPTAYDTYCQIADTASQR